MKVVFCAAEVDPFIKTGGLGDVCGSLPLSLEQIGIKVDIILPHYKGINDRKFTVKKLDKSTSIARIEKNINVYLIDHKKYFDRSGLYGTAKGEYKDNVERFSFFCKAALEVIRSRIKNVKIVHCHDWHTALIPVYLKEYYSDDAVLRNVKTLMTIHNLAYQGVYKKSQFKKLGLPNELYNRLFEFYGKLNLFKAGLITSDRVNTVSEQYAKEIITKKNGCGLDLVLRKRKHKVHGIINGVHYETWDPKIDKVIGKNYSVTSVVSGKKFNKVLLQKELKFEVNEAIPLIGMVSRLSHQKGLDLIIESMDRLAERNIQLVIQGLGDDVHTKKLSKLAEKYPERLAVHFAFNERLAHRIYAGSDFFLMPSIFEPCGLSQLISLKYGTLPIVSSTGGLVDTINGKNGFRLKTYSKKGLCDAVDQALKGYRNKERHLKKMKYGMKQDFSWKHSAKDYKRMYQCM